MSTTYTIVRARDEAPSFGQPELVAARIAAALPSCVVRRSESASPFVADRREVTWIGILADAASNLALEVSLIVADDGEVYGLTLRSTPLNATAAWPSAANVGRGCNALARAVGGVAFDGDGVRVRRES